MTDFLTLVQEVASESGTISNAQSTITSVVGQKGRVLRMVNWVQAAWNDIQREHRDWTFMEREFAVETLAETNAYTPASFNIDDLLSWRIDRDIYCRETDGSNDGRLIPVTWHKFREMFDLNAPTSSRPQYVTVRDYDNAIMFGPTPDKAYSVRGTYRKCGQVLQANTDTPAMREDYQDAIKWLALLKEGLFEEAPDTIAYASSQYNAVHDRMISDLLPKIRVSTEALA